MVAFADPAVAYGAELWRLRRRFWQPQVAPQHLVVLFLERVHLGLKPRDVPLGFLVEHPEPDLVYLAVQVPELLFPDVPVGVGQRLLMAPVVIIAYVLEQRLVDVCLYLAFQLVGDFFRLHLVVVLGVCRALLQYLVFSLALGGPAAVKANISALEF